MKNKDLNIDAIILCGGKGLRLRPLTDNLPKPLIKIKNKEILTYIIEYLIKFRIKRIFIATGYKSNKIKDFLNKNNFNCEIIIIDSGVNTDILKRIKDCTKKINNDFILLYGDTLTNLNIKRLIKNTKRHNKMATISLWQLPMNYGLVDFNKYGQVLSFKEKPKLDKWINIGYFYFKNDIKKLMNKSIKWVNFLHKLVNLRQLQIYKHKDLHITVNTLNELSESERNINKFQK